MRADLLQRLGGSPRRIVVFRALVLGDMVCAVPALRALRHAFPSAEIALVGLPWAHDFARRFAHLVDAFVAFPGFPGLPEREPDREAWPGFVAAMRSRAFDLALQLHGSGETTNTIVRQFGARLTAGFHPADAACSDGATFVRWPSSGTEMERLLGLTDFLGIGRRGLHVEFPVSGEERTGAAALMTACGLGNRAFAIVHPGARMASRRWPADRFARLASALVDAGLRVAITGSGADEAAVCDAVARGAGRGVVNLHGRTTIGTLAGLVQAARLVVCNDTGISHVAAGCGTPSVIVSCGADPTRFAPHDRARHRMMFRMTECRPCMHPVCPIGHPCATLLTVDAVADASFALLRTFAGTPAHALAAAGGER